MILEALCIVFGIMFLIVGLIFNFQMLSFLPSTCLILIGIILLVMDRYWNTFVILINNFNGKKTFKVVKAKKFYQKDANHLGYFLKIQGFAKTYPFPQQEFIQLNLTNGLLNLIFFYQENDALSPCNVHFDIDAVKFISNEMIANSFQMEAIVKSLVKPPQDTLQMIVNIGLLFCMLGCIITMIYQGYKNGINAEIFTGVGMKMDKVLVQLGEFMMKIEGGFGNIAGMTNSTLGNIPPITQ